MKNLFLILLCIPMFSIGQNENTKNQSKNKENKFSFHSDGPYIFFEKNKLVEKGIINGEVYLKDLDLNVYDSTYNIQRSNYRNIDNIAALSDIHGQYDLLIELLTNNKIINNDLNWDFGEGHLVIVGDIFDRGSKVNEVLWLIYKLEIQARKMGGRVHFLLGNHDYMVLQRDLRYINSRYRISSYLLGIPYNELYSNKTILGRWIRSKSTIIKINDIIFTHGGVSNEFLTNYGTDLKKINDIMREKIDISADKMKDDEYDLYYGIKSLIWYRDYFKEYGENLTNLDVTKILKQLNSKHIVVGHSSNEEIVGLYNNKIFGVDSSIKLGKYGELLFVINDRFYRGKLDGQLSEISK